MSGTHIYDPAAESDHKTLRRQYYQKLHTEYLAYEKEVCQKDPADIFYQAKEIVPVMLMYEQLLSASFSFPDDLIGLFFKQDKLIKTCCTFWKNNSSWTAEEALDFYISEICRKEAA